MGSDIPDIDAEMRGENRVRLADLKAQYESIKEEIQDAIERVLEIQQFILGPDVEALEAEIAAHCHCSYGIGVSSGSDALLVSLMALDLKPGDEVITTPYTFLATAGAISRIGARPVFADIDPMTYNLDPSSVENKITQRTRAIVPVHLFGQMANMEAIAALAVERDLWVIEDAAQALGSERNGHRVGSCGHLACFSFFPSKNLGAFGDGGMVITNDAQLADRVRLLRNHGQRPKYHSQIIGGNFRLDTIQAAVLRVKLRHLDAWTQARRDHADLYRQLLAEAMLSDQRGFDCRLDDPLGHLVQSGSARANVFLPYEVPGSRHVYNQFVVRAKSRDLLRAYLMEQGIETEIYYPVPLHLQECFADLGYCHGDLPQSEALAAEALALPIYPELSEASQRRVARSVAKFYESRHV